MRALDTEKKFMPLVMMTAHSDMRRLNAARKYFAIGFTSVVIGLNLTFPIAVLTGVVSVPGA